MSPLGLALRDPAPPDSSGDLDALRVLGDLGAVQSWAVNAAETAPGARTIHATTFAERVGALRHITERLADEEDTEADVVECLLYLAATDPLHACEAAQLLPLPWWKVAVEVLADAGDWSGLWEYLFALRRGGTALADEAFDYFEVLIAAAPGRRGADGAAPSSPSPEVSTAVSGEDDAVFGLSPAWAHAWWKRRDLGQDGVNLAREATAITVELREQQMELAQALSPSKATAYVRARYTSTGSGGLGGSGGGASSDNSWAGLIARIDDPRMLRVLFDQQADLGYDLHLGYPYRRACLANPVLPVDLADRQVVDCGARPGPVRRQVTKVADGTCLDMGVEASRCASAEVVASVIWADPQRWWREIVAPPGKQPVRSRGSEPGPVTWAERAEAFHCALAGVLAQVVTRTREGAADVDEVRVGGEVMATRGQAAEQRLLWLLENASGPGFGAVLEAAVAHPEIKVIRRAASHQQLPPAVAADLIAHPDRWVRAGAERAFSRALGEA